MALYLNIPENILLYFMKGIFDRIELPITCENIIHGRNKKVEGKIREGQRKSGIIKKNSVIK